MTDAFSRVAAIAGVLAVTAGAPAAAQGSVQADICERQAREASGYWGGRIPDIKIGPFTAKIGGSVALGVSRSSGATSAVKVPRGAGAYAREQREAEREKVYKRHYARCIGGN